MNILIADDHPVVAEGLCCLLAKKGYNIVEVCNNGLEALNQIIAQKPSIALLDMGMPGLNGIEIMERMQGQKLPTKTIIYTMENDMAILNRCKELGVKGYLLKDFALEEIELCLSAVCKGDEYFSPHLYNNMISKAQSEKNGAENILTFTERKVLSMVSEQKSSKQIAEQLFITEKTVETHRRNIIRKLKIPPGNSALLLWAAKNTVKLN